MEATVRSTTPEAARPDAITPTIAGKRFSSSNGVFNMFVQLMQVIIPTLFAPQIDFSMQPPGPQRVKSCQVRFVARLASGKSENLERELGQRESPLGMCDEFARIGAIKFWTFHQDGTKLTLFDVEGDPIVDLQVVVEKSDPKDQGVPPAALVQWVPRVVPKIARAELQPAIRGGNPLALATSGAVTAAVTSVAVPEIDFDTIPDAEKRPRVYYLRFHTRLASGKYEENYIGRVDIYDVRQGKAPDDPERRKEVLRKNYAYHAETWFDVLAEPGNLRVAMLDYRCEEGERNGQKDPVVGLRVETNGPVPKVRWTLRPEVRKLLKMK
jgi:hypothetical protein